MIAELPGKREEWIVLSAHYDTTSLSHGAYDNMSGCAGLLGIMEQMKGKELNYGLRFVFCGSEERGLLGAKAYVRDHEKEELSFYSKATTDIEFLFPFGWGELWGVADRTDYDLTQHQNTSGQKMVYREGEGKDMVEYIPYVIEPSLGVERSVLAVLCDAYDEEVVGQDKNCLLYTSDAADD